MALEPITRQEKIIAGQDLEPITRMEMFLKQFGGGGGSGSGFEYDFIIRVSLDETGQNVLTTLEKGTYASIMAKLGKLPINGKVLLNLGEDAQKTDASVIVVEYFDNKLQVCAMNTATIPLKLDAFVINTDNTVTQVE